MFKKLVKTRFFDYLYIVEDINKLLKSNSKFAKLAGPLRAAQVCDMARAAAHDRFAVVSFREGLLTLGAPNSSAANNLRLASPNIIEEINEKLGKEWVEKIRIKLV